MASISVIQLKLNAGRKLTEEEIAKLNAVLDYIDNVAAIDISSAPEINWPVVPENLS
jgi:Asp-tRNA(Asn)/Glu-tRNA(Gln) amidotransferase C subunit